MKDTDKVEFTASELRNMAEDCPEFKRVLEKVKPEVFESQFAINYGGIFLTTGYSPPALPGEPYYAISRGAEHLLSSLSGKLGVVGMAGYKPAEYYWGKVRPMHSGAILLTVSNGRIVASKVTEP